MVKLAANSFPNLSFLFHFKIEIEVNHHCYHSVEFTMNKILELVCFLSFTYILFLIKEYKKALKFLMLMYIHNMYTGCVCVN